VHYELETQTASGDWLKKRQLHKLREEAELAAALIRDAGGVPRLIEVANGIRRVLRERQTQLSRA